MHDIKDIVEVILFASNRPINQEDIEKVIDGENFDIRKVVKELNTQYHKNNKGYSIVNVANGYRIQSNPEYHEYISKINSVTKKISLSNSALEALAIISYKQPISKVEIDNLRGINSSSVINTLLKNDLITIKGREKKFGRSVLYGTTINFLQIFGLSDINDLPSENELDLIINNNEIK